MIKKEELVKQVRDLQEAVNTLTTQLTLQTEDLRIANENLDWATKTVVRQTAEIRAIKDLVDELTQPIAEEDKSNIRTAADDAINNIKLAKTYFKRLRLIRHYIVKGD